jgi:hypothetical protein
MVRMPVFEPGPGAQAVARLVAAFRCCFGGLDPVGEILKLTRNRAEPDTTTKESLNACT